MADDRGTMRHVDWKSAFPWLHLTRAFRIAVDLRKLLLATCGLAILLGGDWLISLLPFAPADADPVRWFRPAIEVAGSATGAGPFSAALPAPRAGDWQAWTPLLRPVERIAEPAAILLRTGNSWSNLAFAWTKLLWTLAVWAVFGGALARMAALQFARDEKIGLWSALRFSSVRFLSYLTAPLLPIAGLGALALLCALGGLIGRIPVVGEYVVGTMWFLPLALGFLMALIVLGWAIGWPLTFATISVEGSDAFDGFSRSFSFVYGRPWQCLWLALVAFVHGTISVFFVRFAAVLIASLAAWGVAGGMGTENARHLLRLAPPPFEFVPAGPSMNKPAAAVPTDASETAPFAAQIVAGWLHVAALLVDGFVHSYFWCAATIAYFLLRRADDATPFGDVYVGATEPRDELLPLVGVADSDQPIVERPATHATEARAAEAASPPAADPSP